jgi:dolichyl-phosphate-mannose--protein O-mannosyl transferase
MFRERPFHSDLNRNDVFLLFVLMIFAFWSHFWLLGYPNAVVFDEVHFGTFTNSYIKSEFFYDIHPPLGKIVMFLFAKLAEYNGSIDFDGGYSRPYPSEVYVSLRFTPAFFSSLCIPLLYLTLRFDSFSSTASFLPAFLAACDSSLLTEHRFILSDGMLHFFSLLFLVLYSFTHSIKGSTRTKWLCLLASGFLLGCACSCKNTAWGLIPFSGFVEVIEVLQTFSILEFVFYESLLLRAVYLIVPMITAYAGSFWLHFVLLPFTGQGTGFLSHEMQQQLLPRNNGSLWCTRLSGIGLLHRTVALSLNMHHGNMGLTQWHPYQSRPINWPFVTGIAVSFWRARSGSEVACLGNAIVYWIAMLGLFACLAGVRTQKWLVALKYVAGWAFCYFPFFLVPRSMYLYHYLIPLMIGCLAVGAAVDLWLPRFWAGFAAGILSIGAFVGFLLWAPFAYGSEQFARQYVIWTQNWMRGDAYHRNLSKPH